jgi:hypothetical protein
MDSRDVLEVLAYAGVDLGALVYDVKGTGGDDPTGTNPGLLVQALAPGGAPARVSLEDVRTSGVDLASFLEALSTEDDMHRSVLVALERVRGLARARVFDLASATQASLDLSLADPDSMAAFADLLEGPHKAAYLVLVGEVAGLSASLTREVLEWDGTDEVLAACHLRLVASAEAEYGPVVARVLAEGLKGLDEEVLLSSSRLEHVGLDETGLELLLALRYRVGARTLKCPAVVGAVMKSWDRYLAEVLPLGGVVLSEEALEVLGTLNAEGSTLEDALAAALALED